VKLNPHRIWAGIFGVWAFFLTGALSGVFGGPGVIQGIRLQNLLQSRVASLDSIQTEVNQLQSESERLEKSSVVQQREIRRVLGYAAPDEVIFDFSSGAAL
jgi:cell division protein FtsB